MTQTDPLAQAFADVDPAQAARLIDCHDDVNDAVKFLKLVSPNTAADLLSRLSVAGAERLLQRIEESDLSSWLEASELEVSTKLLARMTRQQGIAAVAGVSPADTRKKNALLQVLAHAENSVGSVLNFDVWAVHGADPIEKVLQEIARKAHSNQSPLFILDDEDRVIGEIDLQLLLTNRDGNATAANFCNAVSTVNVGSSIPAALSLLDGTDCAVVAAVDHRGRLQGFVSRRALSNSAANNVEVPGVLQTLVALGIQMIQVLTSLVITLLGRERLK